MLAAIKGTIDCGDQTPGSSTVTIAGDTAEGALTAAPLDPVRVECDASPQGTEISASGLTSAGATKVLVSIGLTSDGAVTVDVIAPSASHRYVATGTATITATGGHVRADVVEQKAPPPARTLHAEGDLTCGRNATG